MFTVTNPIKYLLWLGNPPNQYVEPTNDPPQPNLLTTLGQGAMLFGVTLAGYGANMVRLDLEISQPREIYPLDTTFVLDCRTKNGERYYDCRRNHKYIPARIQDGSNICDRLSRPYILDEGVPTYYCEGLYVGRSIVLAGPVLMLAGAGFIFAGICCNKKGRSVEEERQIALAVEPINSFIKDHFEELSSTIGMQMGADNIFVFLYGGRDCITFEGFKDEGNDQVEWCLIEKGVFETRKEYYLLQTSSAKQISGRHPFTGGPLKSDDIRRGQAVLDIFELGLRGV